MIYKYEYNTMTPKYDEVKPKYSFTLFYSF